MLPARPHSAADPFARAVDRACALAHTGFGSYGVLLLALALLLIGTAVLTATWRRRAKPSPGPVLSNEQ